MVFPLASLPLEIILEVLKYLDPPDVLHLAILFKLGVSKSLYSSVFDDNALFDRYDQKLLLERAQCSLYTISRDRFKTTRKVPVSGTIMQLCEADGPLCVVDSGGEILVVDGEENGVGYFGEFDKALDEFRSYIPTQNLPQKPRFVHVSSHEQYISALDGTGLAWECEGSYQRPVFPMVDAQTSQPIRGAILKTCASKFQTAYLVRGTGIVVRHHFSGRRGKAKVVVVPGTARIQDFVLRNGAVVILDREGKVSAAMLGLSYRSCFHPSRDFFPLAELNEKAPFVQLVAGGEDSFVLVAADGQICLCKWTWTDVGPPAVTTVTIADFKHKGVASVASDGADCLILTKKGDVYFVDPTAEASGAVKMGLPGRVYGILADKDYFTALVYETGGWLRNMPVTEQLRHPVGGLKGFFLWLVGLIWQLIQG